MCKKRFKQGAKCIWENYRDGKKLKMYKFWLENLNR